MYDPAFCSANRLHPRLTFDEVNIIRINILYSKTPEELLDRLDNLMRHTPDSCLAASLRALQEKIHRLSPREFAQLREDSIAPSEDVDCKIVFPMNYALPSL